MSKEIFESTEPYLPGISFEFSHPDLSEAERLVRRAIEIPLHIECVAYDDHGRLVDAVSYNPYDDAKNPKTKMRLVQALNDITNSDDVTVTNVSER